MPFSRRIQPIPTLADNLPQEDKLVEAQSCADSFEYFLANYVFILDPEKGKIRFEMWPVHFELAGFIIACDRIIILKARQLIILYLSKPAPFSA